MANPDWNKLCVLYREGQEATRGQLEELKKELLEKPLAPDQTVKLKEACMLMQRDLVNGENFVTFPAREAERLKEIRKELPVLNEKIKELEREETHHA